jgi:hypothetical protein
MWARMQITATCLRYVDLPACASVSRGSGTGSTQAARCWGP